MKISLTASDLAARPGAFDWALRSARSPGDIIRIEDGAVAETRGAWAFPEFRFIGLAAGVRLELGDGAEVRLAKDAATTANGLPRPAKDLHLLWIGDGAEISGKGRLNANGSEQLGWCCGGIRAFGRCSLESVTICGLSGKRHLAESFAFSAEGATGGTVIRDVSVRDCLSSSADDYVSGIYVGGTVDNGRQNVVDRCMVLLGESGQFAFSSSFDTIFSDCIGHAARFLYTDTGDMVATLRHCCGSGAYAVIGSVATSGTPRREVQAIDCNFLSTNGRMVEWWDKGGANRGWVVFRGSKLSAAYGVASDAKSGALVFVGSETSFANHAVTDGSPKPIILP